jgi:hypothetical protein
MKLSVTNRIVTQSIYKSINTKSVALPAQIRTVVTLARLTAQCQMYEEWKSLMPYVHTLFHKTSQLQSARSLTLRLRN